MKLSYLLPMFLVLLFLSGCTSQASENEQTNAAKEVLEVVNSKMIVAEDKVNSGNLDEAVATYKEVKTSLEAYVYNEGVDSEIKSQIKQVYDKAANKINELEGKLNTAKLVTKYKEDYQKLLDNEKNLTTEYKYNPEVNDAISGNSSYDAHCSIFKPKILDLKNNLQELNDEVNSLDTYNSSSIENDKTEISDKVSESLLLVTLMSADYDNWCKTGHINSEMSNFKNSLDISNENYYVDLYCGLMNYGDDLIESAEERQDYLNSENFTLLEKLIIEKQYSFYNVNSSRKGFNLEYDTYTVNTWQKDCKYLTDYQDFLTFIEMKKVSYYYMDDIVSQLDINETIFETKKVYDSCMNLTEAENDCIGILNEYPEEAKTTSCNYEDVKASCEQLRVYYETLETGTEFYAYSVFGTE